METGFKILCGRCEKEYEINLDTFSAMTTDQCTESEVIQTICPTCGYYNVTFFAGSSALSLLYRCHLELEKEMQELRRLLEIHISRR